MVVLREVIKAQQVPDRDTIYTLATGWSDEVKLEKNTDWSEK